MPPAPPRTLPRKRARSTRRPRNLRHRRRTPLRARRPSSPRSVSTSPRQRTPAARRPRHPAPTPARRSSSRQGASTSARRRRAASPAMPASWCCATAPTATCSTWDAGPVPSRPRCAAPSRAGIATSASSPAAAHATATPITWCIGQTAGRPSSPIWCSSAGSTTERCTKKAFKWSPTPRGGSSFCARMAYRCRRCHRRRAGRVPGHRWRRPWRGWRRPASPSVRTPLPQSGMANR